MFSEGRERVQWDQIGDFFNVVLKDDFRSKVI